MAPHFDEPNEAPYETNQETRPPQLNGRVCGCRCGSGVSGAFEGTEDEGSGNEDGASIHTLTTLDVNSNHYETDDESATLFSVGSNEDSNPESLAVQQSTVYGEENIPEVRTRFGGYVNSAEGFILSQHVIGIEDHPIRVHHRAQFLFHDTDDAGASSINQPQDCSDEQSIAAPGPTTGLRCMSPGPGLGAWIEGGWVDDRMNGYHFVDSPLRLTPQLRFCRGLSASHLVLWDDTGRPEPN
ncbi:hypothetical protein BCR34DRAFT_591379 [Clohesyomyces aquaticus]|uniref:Uncharacterized protein n=1 Tax=Clohesyomyces aquaticus TaxID=1231657 RepID=A0A1Y1Z173_9PLEO|nr:hypothetical protein BCR34DRAFT_591379 [Clohesyomyces aquaticus]